MEEDSLVIGRPRVEHVSLQFREESLLIFALTDLHVQQVWMDGGVVDLHQPLLDGLSCRGTGIHLDTWSSKLSFFLSFSAYV